MFTTLKQLKKLAKKYKLKISQIYPLTYKNRITIKDVIETAKRLNLIKNKSLHSGAEPIRILKPEVLKDTTLNNLPPDVIEKMDLYLQILHLKKIQQKAKLFRKVIIVVIEPVLQHANINLDPINLTKLAKWWSERLKGWDYITTNNIIIRPNYINKTITISYDIPPDVPLQKINRNNSMIAKPDVGGNYPIYIKNNNIVSINREDEDSGVDTLVSGKIEAAYEDITFKPVL